MESPQLRAVKERGNELSTTGRRERRCRPQQSDKEQMCPHVTKTLSGYMRFKRKLLKAMQNSDPLQILDLGIFEEFESVLNGRQSPQKIPIHAENRPIRLANMNEQPCEISDFETILQSYQVSEDLKVTQLQRRSRSCNSKKESRQSSWKELQLRNVEFVLWTNALRDLSSSETPQTVLQNIKIQQIQLKLEEQLLIIQDQSNENKKLRAQLAEIQHNHIARKECASSVLENDLDDHRLQYLLKEKQLHKKLQEAKEEISHLRNLLEKSSEHHPTPLIFKQTHEQMPSDPLMILREKVENQGRMKRTLQKLWGNELESRCNEHQYFESQ